MQLQASIDVVAIVLVLLILVVTSILGLWQQHLILQKMDKKLTRLEQSKNKDGNSDHASH